MHCSLAELMCATDARLPCWLLQTDGVRPGSSCSSWGAYPVLSDLQELSDSACVEDSQSCAP